MFFDSSGVRLSDNKVSDNRASHGGGLYFDNSPGAILTYNVINNNVASHLGGGMKHNAGVLFYKSDNVMLIGNTISGNRSANKCGGACFGDSDNASLMWNTIISNSA